jgi:hypothetical protein
MKKFILILIIAVSTALTVPLLGQPAFADCPSAADASTSKDQVLVGTGAVGSDCSSTGVGDTVSAIVSILSYIAGVAGIIMVMLSGFKYITSGGDSGKVAAAKNTLIYALIGLVIASLAQFLVHFVLTTAGNSTSSCAGGTVLAGDGKSCECPAGTHMVGEKCETDKKSGG